MYNPARKEDAVHPDITTAIARRRRTELIAEARSSRLARAARTARRAGGTEPQPGRSGWARLIRNPAHAR
jgi:hypothetical protein